MSHSVLRVSSDAVQMSMFLPGMCPPSVGLPPPSAQMPTPKSRPLSRTGHPVTRAEAEGNVPLPRGHER